MTAFTIGQIRAALAASLSGIPGLRVSATYPGLVMPPAAVVRRLRTDYSTQFNGGHTSTFAVTLYVQTVDVPSGQAALDGYLAPDGPGSVPAALETDTTLGGVVRNLTVTYVNEEGLVELSGVNYLTATIPVLITHE